MQHADPIAVILARMEVKLDQALAEQQRHASILDRHDQFLNEHGNRLTAVETSMHEIPERIVVLEQRRTVTPAALTTAISILLGIITALAAIFAALHH
jgi:phage shock protein A